MKKVLHAAGRTRFSPEGCFPVLAATFKQVVLVEFPRPGLYSIGFITGTQNGEVQAKTREPLVSVFVPTPPLTGGSIVLVLEADVVKLDMSVAGGLKFIMSLGSVSPAYPSQADAPSAGTAGDSKRAGFLRRSTLRLVSLIQGRVIPHSQGPLDA